LTEYFDQIDLGQPDEIANVFTGFQKYLYQRQVAV